MLGLNKAVPGAYNNRGHIQADEGRDTPVVRILPIKVTSQGASSSGIPLQGANSLACNHKELAILANLWREGT
jgi:hypothetical protein